MSERGRDRYSRSRYGSKAESPEPREATPLPEVDTSSADRARARLQERQERMRERAQSAQVHDAGLEAEGNVESKAKSRRASAGGGHLVRNIAVAVVAVALIGAGLAFAYVASISGNLHAGVDQDLRNALVETDMTREPFYMLLLGTDGSSERYSDDGEGASYRTDSMMLARIDPVNKKATLISIPRDLQVDLGKYGEEKINAAYAYGGAALSVETVADLARVPISHYASVDFDGFAAMVDALGGVEVDVPMDIDDADAGGSLKVGMQTLNGEQALILCRARNAYADIAAHPDEMRAANQRLVLAAIARKLLSSDVATIASTVSAMSKYVTTDLSLNDIIGLAQAMRGLDPAADIYTAAVPTESKYVDDVWYEYLEKPEWDAMLKRLKAGEPPLEQAVVDEATGTVLATAGVGAASIAEKYATVSVLNGTEIEGLATSVRSKLRDVGFVNVEVGSVIEGTSYPETLVLYEQPERAHEAEEIVGVLGQGRAMLNDGSYLLSANLTVIIGNDWRS